MLLNGLRCFGPVYDKRAYNHVNSYCKIYKEVDDIAAFALVGSLQMLYPSLGEQIIMQLYNPFCLGEEQRLLGTLKSLQVAIESVPAV